MRTTVLGVVLLVTNSLAHAKYRLTFRSYGPIDGVANGTYFPPPVVKQ